eukprot:TRINITY_DN39603_c0_g1_i1.p1 TRINITY_DN39603_c0_g1~~TRINITY_DN39603_c0_g1_i1.p1  ORF type:complete len:117 (+),score=5.96 TRINITY_DN39603_c0_g1_i1:52-351(+)
MVNTSASFDSFTTIFLENISNTSPLSSLSTLRIPDGRGFPCLTIHIELQNSHWCGSQVTRPRKQAFQLCKISSSLISPNSFLVKAHFATIQLTSKRRYL